jgi:ssDNA-binding Zn-finger/Zn-ribbon topoisomerase 1
MQNKKEKAMLKCPVCGEEEVEFEHPRTKYACGSTDYDQRPGTFKKGVDCINNKSLKDRKQFREDVLALMKQHNIKACGIAFVTENNEVDHDDFAMTDDVEFAKLSSAIEDMLGHCNYHVES